MSLPLQAGDSLLVVDIQNDFLPGGALAVPNGDEVISIINQWIKQAEAMQLPIIFSRDWHPSNHISFKQQDGPWPPHCVQNTDGAEFAKELYIPQSAIIVNKGFHTDQEAYSAFEGLTLENLSLSDKLKSLGVRRIWISGLALDYCVYHSALGAHKAGFEVHIILDACRSIAKNTEEKAFHDFKKMNIGIFSRAR